MGESRSIGLEEALAGTLGELSDSLVCGLAEAVGCSPEELRLDVEGAAEEDWGIAGEPRLDDEDGDPAPLLSSLLTSGNSSRVGRGDE